MKLSDHELMVRTAQGDHEAFDVLFERHLPRVRGFLFRLVGDEDLAEELSGEVFFRVWRYAASFDGRHFQCWLYKVARNVAACERGQDYRRAIRFADLSEWNLRDVENRLMSEEDPTAVEAMKNARLRCIVVDALRRLNRVTREALILRVYEAQTYEQIGAVQKCSTGVARARVNRAYALLRAALFADQRKVAP